jgi:hypothetical protein
MVPSALSVLPNDRAEYKIWRLFVAITATGGQKKSVEVAPFNA